MDLKILMDFLRLFAFDFASLHGFRDQILSPSPTMCFVFFPLSWNWLLNAGKTKCCMKPAFIACTIWPDLRTDSLKHILQRGSCFNSILSFSNWFKFGDATIWILTETHATFHTRHLDTIAFSQLSSPASGVRSAMVKDVCWPQSHQPFWLRVCHKSVMKFLWILVNRVASLQWPPSLVEDSAKVAFPHLWKPHQMLSFELLNYIKLYNVIYNVEDYNGPYCLFLPHHIRHHIRTSFSKLWSWPENGVSENFPFRFEFHEFTCRIPVQTLSKYIFFQLRSAQHPPLLPQTST